MCGRARSGLFSEPLLVVKRKPELVESTPIYVISDRNGARVGSVADVGQRELRTALRPGPHLRQAARGVVTPAEGFGAALRTLSSVVRQLPYRVEVQDEAGAAVLVLTSAEVWGERSLITVARGDGVTVGQITRENGLVRKPRYSLEARGQRVGTIVAEHHWTLRHHVLDVREREVARIAPRRDGWFARTLGREPVSFAVHIFLPLAEPLHSLLLAGALTADTALKRYEPVAGTS
jgi:hypothetical protein